MTPQETPVQIDLSQDIASQGIQLSPEEQASYQAYIETLEAHEREAIITLTQAELATFKASLGYENNHHQDRNEVIASFIQEQKLEGADENVSISDIMGQINGVDIESAAMESAARETLFGPEWIMKDLNLSESARDSISASLFLAVLEKINSGETFTPEQLAAMSSFEMSTLFASESETLQALSSTFGETEIVGPWITKSKIDISANGDANIIFSNILEGKAFFSQVLSGDINSENLENEIEAKNTQEWNPALENNVAKILELTQSDILGIMEKARMAINNPAPSTQTPDSETWVAPSTTPEGTVLPAELPVEVDQTLIEQWKESGNVFLQILATLIEAIGSFGKWLEEGTWESVSETTTPTQSETTDSSTSPEAGTETPSEKLISLFNGLQEDFPAGKENVLRELSQNPETASKMLSALESISADETVEVSFSHLFGNDRIDGVGLEVFQVFEWAELFATLPEGTTETQKIVLLVEEYARYRNSAGVIGQTEDRTTWEAYALTRKQQWWSIDLHAWEDRR